MYVCMYVCIYVFTKYIKITAFQTSPVEKERKLLECHLLCYDLRCYSAGILQRLNLVLFVQ